MDSRCALARVAALFMLASLQQAACFSAQMRGLSAWRIPPVETAFAAVLLPRTDFSPVPPAGRLSRRAAPCAMMQDDLVASDTAQASWHMARGVGSDQHLRRPQAQGINKTNSDPGALVFNASSAFWTEDQKVANVVRITRKLEFLHNLQKYIVQLQFGNGLLISVQKIN